MRAGTITLVVMLVAVALLAGCHERRDSTTAVEVSICELVAQPSSFRSKVVRVHAFVESDGIEHVVLLDRSCPDTGVAVQKGDWVESQEAISALWKVLLVDHPGTRDKEVSGYFTGTFEVHKNKIPTRRFLVKSIAKLTTTKKHEIKARVDPGSEPNE